MVKELPASFYDVVDADPHGQDLDAWWESQTGERPTARIAGMDVPIPAEVPAEMALRPEKVFDLDPDSEEDQRKITVLLAQILTLAGVDGEQCVEDLISNGIGMQQLGIVFTWALVNGMRPPGKPAVSFARCAQIAAEDDTGKATPVPNRTDRRSSARVTVAKSRAKRTPGIR